MALFTSIERALDRGWSLRARVGAVSGCMLGLALVWTAPPAAAEGVRAAPPAFGPGGGQAAKGPTYRPPVEAPIGRPYRPRRKTGQRLVLIDRGDPLDRLSPPEQQIILVPGPPEPETTTPETTTPGAAEPDPGPPDPASPIRRSFARGAAVPPPRYRIGQALPRRLPQVTLNWRSYALPEPPPGEIYVRVGRDLLRIEAASRVVTDLVAPL
ncbi:MAG: RcnB family protein [Pseudomonadota bacterium]